jgi:hypothetical protein
VASCSRVGPLVSSGRPRSSSHRRAASAVSAAVRVVRPAARARLPGRLEMMASLGSCACRIQHLFARPEHARESPTGKAKRCASVCSVLTGPVHARPAAVRAHERSTTSRPSAASDTARPSS